jgi:hypothetical protein
MRATAFWVSTLALAGTIAPSLFYLAGAIDHDRTKLTMLIATIAWFAATPLWMGRERASSVEAPGR